MTRALLVCAAMLALAGCDQVFDLDRPDAPPPACADLTDHDEDGDGVVDPCDNCPGVANPLQEDLLESGVGELPDGVGDACDPRAQTGGDYIERFHSFAEPGAMSRWEVVSGPWRIDGERMVFDDPDSRSPVYVFQLGGAVPIPSTIEVHVTVRDIQDNWAMIGVVGNASVQDGDGTSCMVYRPFETPDQGDVVKVFHPEGQADADLAQMIASGDGYRLTFRLETDRVRCNALEDGGPQQGLTADLDDPMEPGALGLVGQGLDAAVDHVIVYAITGPP